MTTCLGKSCSFGLPRVPFCKLLSIYVFSCFPFGFEGRMWDLIVSVPDHCLSFYFDDQKQYICSVVSRWYRPSNSTSEDRSSPCGTNKSSFI